MQLASQVVFHLHIKSVAETSFQYYSYFKHLVNAPTLSEGIDQLKRDNLTEHGRTINIFYRFNIHQELFIAAAYSVYDFGLKPIFFYIRVSQNCQGDCSFLWLRKPVFIFFSVRFRAARILPRRFVCHRVGADRHVGGRRADVGAVGRAQVSRHEGRVHDPP